MGGRLGGCGFCMNRALQGPKAANFVIGIRVVTVARITVRVVFFGRLELSSCD